MDVVKGGFDWAGRDQGQFTTSAVVSLREVMRCGVQSNDFQGQIDTLPRMYI